MVGRSDAAEGMRVRTAAVTLDSSFKTMVPPPPDLSLVTTNESIMISYSGDRKK